MSMSGIEIDSEIVTVWDDMKIRKAHKWITFRISDDKKSIIIENLGDPQPTETREEDQKIFDEQVKEKMTVSEPRYILYDFSFRLRKEGRQIQKIGFIFWCDDNAPVKKKMLYASSKDTIKKAFTGLGIEFQAKDMGDFDYDAYADEVERKS